MRLLLDSHCLLWWLEEEPNLSERIYALLKNPDTDVYVSAATIWELEIKRSLGRLNSPPNLGQRVLAEHFLELAIGFVHALAAATLPRHHNDPFDRMLVAQAQLEDLQLVTSDRDIFEYDVKLLPATD